MPRAKASRCRTATTCAWSMSSRQDMLHAEGEGKQMPNRDDMLQALQNFTEMHATLLANREDQMIAQMREWKDTFFERNRDRQYHRNRGRVEEIKKILATAQEEIRSLEGTEVDDYREDGGDN